MVVAILSTIALPKKVDVKQAASRKFQAGYAIGAVNLYIYNLPSPTLCNIIIQPIGIIAYVSK